jgi:hypothetical protein
MTGQGWRRRRPIGWAILTSSLMLGAMMPGPVLAQGAYQADLGPMPLDEASKKNIRGRGEAAAQWDGKRLTITGKFDGLASPATRARLFIGRYIGVPAEESLALTVSPAETGTVSGELPLNARQAAAFRTGKTYVQIDSQKAPDGNLWGWLLPAHEDAAPGIPQAAPWFLPQLHTPSR